MLLIVASLILLFLVALGLSQSFRKLVSRHRFGMAVLFTSVAGLVILAFVAIDYLSVDACLDGGGRWDYERGVCQHEEPSSTR